MHVCVKRLVRYCVIVIVIVATSDRCDIDVVTLVIDVTVHVIEYKVMSL